MVFVVVVVVVVVAVCGVGDIFGDVGGGVMSWVETIGKVSQAMVGVALSGQVQCGRVPISGASRLKSASYVQDVDRWRPVVGAAEGQDSSDTSLGYRAYFCPGGSTSVRRA